MSITYLPRYLARLGLAGPPRPTLDALADLQRRHLLTFPFENLCLHLPELRAPILLDHDALVAKLVDEAEIADLGALRDVLRDRCGVRLA